MIPTRPKGDNVKFDADFLVAAGGECFFEGPIPYALDFDPTLLVKFTKLKQVDSIPNTTP